MNYDRDLAASQPPACLPASCLALLVRCFHSVPTRAAQLPEQRRPKFSPEARLMASPMSPAQVLVLA